MPYKMTSKKTGSSRTITDAEYKALSEGRTALLFTFEKIKEPKEATAKSEKKQSGDKEAEAPQGPPIDEGDPEQA